MAERIQKHIRPQRDAEVREEKPTEAHSAQELKDELDALLDEIDDALEENAEAFVSGFVRGNGE